MVRLVLFDIDGTLIRTGGAGMVAFERVFNTEFGRLDGARGLSFSGRTDTSIVRDFFRNHEVHPASDDFHRFFDRYVFWLDHILHQMEGRVLPGVRELITGLKALSEPPVIGLLTGNIRLGAEIKLRHYGLWDHFETGAFGDDHEDRNQIAVVARERGRQLLGSSLDGDEIIVVGDTPHDITCARAIDARCLAVATGGITRSELEGHEPAWLVDDLTQISAGQLCR